VALGDSELATPILPATFNVPSGLSSSIATRIRTAALPASSRSKLHPTIDCEFLPLNGIIGMWSIPARSKKPHSDNPTARELAQNRDIKLWPELPERPGPRVSIGSMGSGFPKTVGATLVVLFVEASYGTLHGCAPYGYDLACFFCWRRLSLRSRASRLSQRTPKSPSQSFQSSRRCLASPKAALTGQSSVARPCILPGGTSELKSVD
jgi:hypothetical protein